MHHYWMVQVVVEDDEIINYLYGSTIGFGACNMTVPTNERSHGRSLSNNVYINKYRRTNILCVTGKYCAWNRESNCSGCRDNISSRNVTLLSVGCLLLIVRSIFIVTKSWHNTCHQLKTKKKKYNKLLLIQCHHEDQNQNVRQQQEA